MKIGFTCGAFDLLHAGHALMLKECRELCDYLIVGLQDDPSVNRPNKNKPIQSLPERYELLQAIKYVDEIKLYKTEEDLVNLLKTTKIDIRFVGMDWKNKEYTGKGIIPVHFNSRSHSYSTTELRDRVYRTEKARRNE